MSNQTPLTPTPGPDAPYFPMDTIDDAVAAMDRLLERSLAAQATPEASSPASTGPSPCGSATGSGTGSSTDDFERISDVLADMVDRMQEGLARVSPWTVLADRVGCRFDECLSAWSIGYARRRAGTSRSGWPWTYCPLVIGSPITRLGPS